MKFLKPDEYLPSLELVYLQLREEILNIMPQAIVDHIGSSAIKGAISKGDLDILVRVERELFNIAYDKIRKMGFSEKQGTLRTDSLCMLVTDKYNHDVAIQLVEKGTEFEMFLVFRDRLNSNPTLVLEYNKLKEESVGKAPEEYRKRKSIFIESILKK